MLYDLFKKVPVTFLTVVSELNENGGYRMLIGCVVLMRDTP